MPALPKESVVAVIGAGTMVAIRPEHVAGLSVQPPLPASEVPGLIEKLKPFVRAA